MNRALLAAVLLAAPLVQLILFNELRPFGVPANLVNVLVLCLALVGRGKLGLLAAVCATLFLEAFSSGGAGLHGLALVTAFFIIRQVREMFGVVLLNRWVCLVSGLVINQLLLVLCLLASGGLLFRAEIWWLAGQAMLMDCLLGTAVFLFVTKVSSRGWQFA
jgi:hypothetical protein